MDYKIVQDFSKNIFEVMVVDLMARGWSVQGGVAVIVRANNEVVYTQAMVKYK